VFNPVRSLARIPEKEAYEHLFLEFKGDPKSYWRTDRWDRFEMAKDVAAFANTLGGAIVIGAIERGKVVLEQYNPVSKAELALFQTAHRDAIDKLCSPSPLIDPVHLPYGSGALLALKLPERVQRAGERWAESWRASRG
jgi:hypothetical protein